MMHIPPVNSIYKAASRKIRSGEYFKEALGWYNFVYVRPISEYSSVLVLFAILSAAGFFGFLAFSGIFPVISKVPFFISQEYNPNLITSIHPLAPEGVREPAKLSVSRHLISEYVKNREEYDPALIKERYRIVNGLSEKAVFLEYDSSIRKRIAAYERHTARKTEISSVEITDRFSRLIKNRELSKKAIMDVLHGYSDDNVPAHATVRFAATTTDSARNSDKTHWQVDIDFTYKDAIVGGDGKVESPRLMVTSYEIKQLVGD